MKQFKGAYLPMDLRWMFFAFDNSPAFVKSMWDLVLAECCKDSANHLPLNKLEDAIKAKRIKGGLQAPGILALVKLGYLVVTSTHVVMIEKWSLFPAFFTVIDAAVMSQQCSSDAQQCSSDAQHCDSDVAAMYNAATILQAPPANSQGQSALRIDKDKNRIEENTLFESTGSIEPLSPAIAVGAPPASGKRAKKLKAKPETFPLPMLDLETSAGWNIANAWAQEQNINPSHPGFRRFFATRMASREKSAAWIVNFRVSGWASNETSGAPKTWTEYLKANPPEQAASDVAIAAAELPQQSLFEAGTANDEAAPESDAVDPLLAHQASVATGRALNRDDLLSALAGARSREAVFPEIKAAQ